MSEISTIFLEEVNNRTKEKIAPSQTTEIEHNTGVSLSIRNRGCFITNLALINKTTSEKIHILYTEEDLSVPKLNASHIMLPVGSSTEVIEKHGFPRWADYHEFSIIDDKNEKQVAFQAKRPDMGLGLVKMFEISEDSLVSNTTIFNSELDIAKTSLGEHLYFRLNNEDINNIQINRKTLNELLGENSSKDVSEGKSIFWSSFSGEIRIDFPEGHSIQLNAQIFSSRQTSLGMLIWHRPGSNSICFEPTAGFNPETGNLGLAVEPYDSATLSTRIKLLSI